MGKRGGSLAELAAGIGVREWGRVLGALSAAEREILLADWRFWERGDQRPPRGAWKVWLILAGRGAGKTRTGAEWVRALALRDGRMRIALVGATMADARGVMVEGESGLLSLGRACERPRWEPSLGRLTWATGARATLYSAEAPEALRGPQHHHAWCDEIAKWRNGEAAWDNLRFGLRMGALPRIVATTTPRPTALLRRLLGEPGVAVRRARTADNLALSPEYLESMEAVYGGTRLGRQELDAELFEEVEGALWTRDMMEGARQSTTLPRGEMKRVVVGVDPPASSTGDACGIVAVGLGTDGRGVVLADDSVERAAPERWARAVAASAARHGADKVVAEANNGGEMVRSVLLAAEAGLPVRLVHASRGKVARAEPVAALYGRGMVAHAGRFPALEDELCGLAVGGVYEGPGRSPDRADALIWAVTELMLPVRGEPSVRVL